MRKGCGTMLELRVRQEFVRQSACLFHRANIRSVIERRLHSAIVQQQYAFVRFFGMNQQQTKVSRKNFFKHKIHHILPSHPFFYLFVIVR